MNLTKSSLLKLKIFNFQPILEEDKDSVVHWVQCDSKNRFLGFNIVYESIWLVTPDLNISLLDFQIVGSIVKEDEILVGMSISKKEWIGYCEEEKKLAKQLKFVHKNIIWNDLLIF